MKSRELTTLKSRCEHQIKVASKLKDEAASTSTNSYWAGQETAYTDMLNCINLEISR